MKACPNLKQLSGEDRRTLALNVTLDLLDVGAQIGFELRFIEHVRKGWWWNWHYIGWRAHLTLDGRWVQSDVSKTIKAAVSSAVRRAIETECTR